MLIDLAKSSVDAPGLSAAAAAKGVLISSMGPRLGRVIFHLDVDDNGADQIIDVLTGI